METSTQPQPQKKGSSLPWVLIMLLCILGIVLIVAISKNYTIGKSICEDSVFVKNQTKQVYDAGFKDGIQYRNALIVQDLANQGFTVMYDANDMSRMITLIPRI